MFYLVNFAECPFSNNSFNFEIIELGGLSLFLLEDKFTWFTFSSKFEAGVVLAKVITFYL